MKRILQIFTLLLLLIPSSLVHADDTRDVDVVYSVRAQIVFVNDNITIIEKIQVGAKLKEPSHIEKPGYEFVGWFNGDVKWDFDKPIEEGMSLTARYKKIEGSSPSQGGQTSPDNSESTNNMSNGASNIAPGNKPANVPVETKPGEINTDNDTSDNILNIQVLFENEDIVLSKQDQERIENGEPVTIKTTAIDNSDNIKQEDKSLIEQYAKENDLTIYKHVSAKLQRKFDDETEFKDIEAINGLVDVTLTVPEDARGENREYVILKVVDGAVIELFRGKVNDDYSITFETEEPIEFTLTYQDLTSSDPIIVPSDDNKSQIDKDKLIRLAFYALAALAAILATYMVVTKVIIAGGKRFKIDGKAYATDIDMTWNEWCNSSHNKGNYYISKNRVCVKAFDDDGLYKEDRVIEDVEAEDKIDITRTYTTISLSRGE